MNIKKTKLYYDNLSQKEICCCAYCKNYVNEIEKTYTNLSLYLKSIGVDILKPFETMPLEPDIYGNIEYVGVQYIVFGDINNFTKKEIGKVTIDISDSHPSTDIEDKHFVIEVYPIILKWVMD